VAYFFSPNRTLLPTFTNPTPATVDLFGYAVAGVGSDRVLIGAYQDNTGASDAGAAYLFNTNGTLLITFTNPTPVSGDYFGYAVAGVGSDRVLIGAYRDGASSAGAAYLFSTNGTLLRTFTNPTPEANDYFGFSVAAVGSDRVVIGAYLDDTGATDAGAAYLFSLATSSPTSPRLTIVRGGPGQASISWTPNTPGFALQETLSLSPTNWVNSPTGDANPVIVPVSLPTKFYRLFKP